VYVGCKEGRMTDRKLETTTDLDDKNVVDIPQPVDSPQGTTKTTPDSSDLLNMIEDDDLRELYSLLGSSTPYGNQAERDCVKKRIIAINEKLKVELPTANAFLCMCGSRTPGLHYGECPIEEKNDSFGDRHNGEFVCPKR
jgi:hypothetical protein